MQTRYIYLLKYILPITDILMLNTVYFCAGVITGYLGKSVSDELARHYVVVCNLIWLFSALLFGLYGEYGARRLERIYRGTWRTVILHFFIFSFYLMLAKDMGFSRYFLLIFYVLTTFSFAFNRFLGTAFQVLVYNKMNGKRKVAVMGFNPTGNRLAEYMKMQANVDFYGFIGSNDYAYNEQTGMLSDEVITEMEEAATNGVKDLYVAVEPQRMAKIHILLQEADKQCLRLKFVPDIAGMLATPYTISYMGGEFPMIKLRHEPLEDMSNRFKKRIFDIAFSLLVIVFVLSWLYPIIAFLIKLQSKGPVLFKQLRSGRNDEPFWCYKFRSMRVNAASDSTQAVKGDSRITSLGKFLRRTSMDELPQFFNVLAGNMSVVGPRPHMLKHTEEYKAIISQFMVRHFLKPGITGWAQVNGCRGETKQDGAMEKRVQHDIWYLENWSGMLDVKIIFLTILNMLRGEDNAY